MWVGLYVNDRGYWFLWYKIVREIICLWNHWLLECGVHVVLVVVKCKGHF
jgi:hypothetical protein